MAEGARWGRRLAIALAVAAGLGLAAVLAFRLWLSAATGDPAFFAGEIEAFEAADRADPPDPGTIVFVGSSSIRFWKSLGEDMAPLAVSNRGFGGAQLEHVIWAAPRIVTPLAPRAVVVYAGDNDLASGTGKTAADVERDFRTLVRTLRDARPDLPVIFLSIKPSRLRWSRWPEMAEANRRIAAFCASQPGLAFLDVATPLLDARGEPRGDVFRFDGLHLNETGYAAWTGVVRPWLLERFAGGAPPPDARP